MAVPDVEIPEEEYEAVAMLLEHLKSDEAEKRLAACKQLDRIAAALGPQRTRQELLPFLDEGADDEEEILVVIAEKIQELAPFLAADPTPPGSAALLVPLESFARIEENAVRTAVVQACEAVVRTFTPSQVQEQLFPMVMRLGAKEWLPCRLSASCLLHLGADHLTPGQRAEYLDLFLSLCGDDAVMARRMAAANFGPTCHALAAAASPAERVTLQEKCVPEFKSLAADEMDAVRIHVCEAAVSLAEAFDASVTAQDLLPLFCQLSREPKWRVRWSAAVHLPDLCRAVGKERAEESLAGTAASLLNDAEAEVRAAAVANAAPLMKTLPAQVAQDGILPPLLRLAEDPSPHVRLALGTCLSSLAPVLGASVTAETVLPTLLALLRDEATDVRLAVLHSMEPMQKVLGAGLLGDSILPAVLGLASDAKWRVRLAVVSALPTLASHLASEKLTPELLEMSVQLLLDPVFSIRKAMVDGLAEMVATCSQQGMPSAAQWITERLRGLATESTYEPRLTSALALEALCRAEGGDGGAELVSLLVGLSRDPIPNVRIAVARALGWALGAGIGAGSGSDAVLRGGDGMEGAEEENGVEEALQRLSEDGDPDVVYFAKKALQTKEAGEA